MTRPRPAGATAQARQASEGATRGSGAVLKAGARAMLDALIAAWPEPMTRAELAAAAELEPSGGTFGTYLSTLRRNGLADVEGGAVRAAEVLFLRA